jgi:hypothetical protein
MRKPRDFDSELKALADKAKQLKERRVQQLGELVIATGADAPTRKRWPVRCSSSPKPRRRKEGGVAQARRCLLSKQGAQAWRRNSRPAGRHSPA